MTIKQTQNRQAIICKYSVAEKKALGEKKMWSRSNYWRLRPVIFNGNAINQKAIIHPVYIFNQGIYFGLIVQLELLNQKHSHGYKMRK